MRTYTREYRAELRALDRAERHPLPWSRGFITFWLLGLSVICGAILASMAHA